MKYSYQQKVVIISMDNREGTVTDYDFEAELYNVNFQCENGEWDNDWFEETDLDAAIIENYLLF